MNTFCKLSIASSFVLISTVLSAASGPHYSTACMNCSAYMSGGEKYTSKAPKYIPASFAKKKPLTSIPSTNLASVITSSELGLVNTYAPDDLLQQFPGINEEVALLLQRQAFTNKTGYNFDKPTLELSGGLEGNIAYTDHTSNNNASTKDQNLTLGTAELDTQYIVNDYASGYTSFAYNNEPISSNNRSPQSDLYLKRAFIMFGNLNDSPLYMSVGKMFVPFGSYSSAMVTTPVTEAVGRILSPTAAIGVYYHGLNLVGFAYSGSKTSGNKKFDVQGGARFGIHRKTSKGDFALNVSYVTNIADSQGMQSNGIPTIATTANQRFQGFAQGTNGNQLSSAVPGFDVALKSSFSHFSFIGEYMMAANAFNSSDLTFNATGAKPQAMQGEIDINWTMFNRPFTIGAFMGQTKEALALNLPKQSYGAVISTSLVKDTNEAIEFRQDKNYGTTDTATGRGQGAGAGPISGIGKSNSTITARIGIYF